MIFSKFFKPSWQHKDSTVRIEAINSELTIANDEHYNVLMELAKNDENELVRRAALLKINSLSVWFEASQSNSLNAIKTFAEKQVEKILLGQHDIRLTVKDKKQFVDEKLKAGVLESWLKVESDPEIVLALFNRMNKPQLLHSVFKQHQNEDVQLALLSQYQSSEGIEKLIKIAANDKVKQTIEDIVAKDKEQKEKPKRIAKAAQLTLSKYLALRDAKEYANAIETKRTLINEWQELVKDFSYLEQDQADNFQRRFNEIEIMVEKVLAPQAEAFEQEKIARELQVKRLESLKIFNQAKKDIELKITEAIFDNSLVDESSTNQEIDTLIAQVTASVIENKDKAELVAQLASVKNKLNQLPQVAEAVSSATHLISKMSQVSFPESIEQLDDKQSQYRQWKDEWRKVSKAAAGVLPDSIQNAYVEIKNNWDKALAPLIQEQKKQFHITQRKLKDVSRLVNSGKYNAAFGVFKKANKLYDGLSELQQNKLSREYQSVAEKIAELSDWEHYIATPRKQEILIKIEELAEKPLANPNEQATQVKNYRKMWNSLGHADDELERELNEKFNVLSEQAFAPCRLFYAEQEKLREQHLLERNKILADARNLAAQPIDEHLDWKQYESQFNKIKQNWRNAGEVDRTVYRDLNKTFKQAIESVKKAIDEKHHQSITAKKQLIDQAKHLLNSDDLSQAVSEVKALQAKWKTLGYSGPKHENPLWKEFREINDQLFAKRSDEFEASKKEAKQVEENCRMQINEITNSLNINDLTSVVEVTRNLTELKEQLQTQGIEARSIEKIFKTEQDKLNKLTDKLKEKARSENWKLVFNAMQFMVEGGIEDFDAFDDISPIWQKRLLEVNKKHPADFNERTDKTLILEILASKESPENEQKRRLELQLSLMQDQMNSGKIHSVEQGLIDWLALGSFKEQDKPLIARAQAIFI